MSSTPYTPESNKSSKSKRSPFLVDLLAECERIDEEYKVRHKARQIAEKKKEKAKNESILRASQEPTSSTPLGELRREKRRILEEEKRLKALIELEKINSHRKNDRQKAEIAEKRRHEAKLEKRRTANKEEIAKREEAKIKMLQIKHNLISPTSSKPAINTRG